MRPDLSNLLKPITGTDPKDWARRIIKRHEAGEKLNPTTLRFAREALKPRVTVKGDGQ